MALMLKSGVSLVEALRLNQKLIRDYSMKQMLADVERQIMRGEPLHVALKKHGIFDARYCLMVQVAEEAHALHNMFEMVAEQYRSDLDHKSKLIGTLLEPLIILFLGGIVGFILLAMYLPIFQMGSGGF